MNRREFFKILGISAITPSLAGISVSQAIPSRYRGFNVRVDKAYKYGQYVKQVYVSNGDYHCAILFDEEKPDAEIWKAFQPSLDSSIDRKLGKAT